MMPTRRWMTAFAIGVFALAFFANGCGGGNGYTPPPSGPTVTVAAAPASVSLGNQVTVTWSSTNVTSCSASGDWSGTKSVSGSETETPATAGTKSYTLTCTGAGGSASATATVAVIDDMAKLVSVDLADAFCPAECMLLVTINGTNFKLGDTLYFGSTAIPLASDNVESSEVKIIGIFDTPHYFPGRQKVYVDRGGRSSNALYFSFLGNLNTLALSTTEAFQLDQGRGYVVVYDLTSGAKLREFPLGRLMYDIAFDDGKNLVVYTHSYGVGFDEPSGNAFGGINDVFPPMAVSARDGYACVSEPAANRIIGLDLSQDTPPIVPAAVGDNPWNVVMTSFGSRLACVSYNAGDSQLSVVKVPDMILWNSTTLTGLTPMGKLPDIALGGWQLAVIEVSPTVKIAAALSRHDKKIVFTKIEADSAGNLTLTELPTVTLDGVPFRIAADNVHGTLVAAMDDNVAGITRFVKIDPATGAVTELQTTTTLFTAGLAVSADGSQIIGCEGSNCAFLPNQ